MEVAKDVAVNDRNFATAFGEYMGRVREKGRLSDATFVVEQANNWHFGLREIHANNAAKSRADTIRVP